MARNDNTIEPWVGARVESSSVLYITWVNSQIVVVCLAGSGNPSNIWLVAIIFWIYPVEPG